MVGAAMKSTDEMLREYLDAKPNELMGTMFREMQANEARRLAWEESHEKKDDDRHLAVIAALGGHDARIKRVETSKASIAPQSLERFRSAEGSGSYRIPEHELEEALKAVQAKDALIQKNAVLSAVGKVIVGVATGAALLATGAAWRDCTATRQTTVNVAPQGPGK